VIISFDETPPDPQWTAYMQRVERNARPKCEFCGAFISFAHAKTCYRWTDYGNEYEPQCEIGKGCNR